MSRSIRARFRIVFAVCAVVLGLMVPITMPFAKSGNNLKPLSHPLTYTGNEIENEGGIISEALNTNGWLGNLSSTPQVFDICLQDDTTRDTLQINSATGEYKYTRCSDGRMLTGVSVVTTRECTVTFQDFAGIRRVLAKVDNCVHSGTASIKISATVDILNVTITDRNTTNNTCDCTAPPDPPFLPRENISVGNPSFFIGSGNVIVSVPITISRLGSGAAVEAAYSLFIVNDQGQATLVEVGTITSTLASGGGDNCTLGNDPGSGCSGSCADRQIVIMRGCIGGTPDCIPMGEPGRRIPAQCQTSCIGIFCFERCGCEELVTLQIGPFPTGGFGANPSIRFRLDPNGQVPEFDETDNEIIVPIPPRCPQIGRRINSATKSTTAD